VARKSRASANHIYLEYYLGGKDKPPILKEESWINDDGKVTRYSLAYIDPLVSPKDNGRLLGYDNAHGRHHRHFMGVESSYEFRGYDDLLSRFYEEVAALRRRYGA